MRGRFFQRVSDSAWLARVDTESSLATADAELHCAAEYGVPVRAVDVDLLVVDFDVLRAQRRVGAVAPPPQPPAPLTADKQAWASATPPQKLELLARKLGFVA